MADPRCRSGRQCSAITSDGPAITAKANTLCAACVQDLQKKLDALPHLASALRVFIGGSVKIVYESKVRATHEPQCPMDVRVDELLTDIADVVDRCDHLRVADLIQQPAMKFKIWYRDRVDTKYLAGYQRALDIRRVHARANAILGFDRIYQKRHAPCPNCNLPTLGNYVGDSTVLCSDKECGAVMSLDEYDRHCAEAAGGV